MRFLECDLKHEVGGKSVQIASNRLVKVLGLYPIQASEVTVEYDLLAANLVDQLGEVFNRCHQVVLGSHRWAVCQSWVPWASILKRRLIRLAGDATALDSFVRCFAARAVVQSGYR